MDEVGTGATDELEEEPSASQMAGKSPNFCVLLHGSLKVEGMVALVQLGWDATGLFIFLTYFDYGMFRICHSIKKTCRVKQVDGFYAEMA